MRVAEGFSTPSMGMGQVVKSARDYGIMVSKKSIR